MERIFCPDDIVVSKADGSMGVIDRTHGDPDTHEPFPGRQEQDTILRDPDVSDAAFRKFMRDGVPPKGTVFLHYTHKTTPALVSESKLDLLDRSLLIGDVVKKNVRDAMSGVILNTSTVCTLMAVGNVKYRGSHILKGLVSPNWNLVPELTIDERPIEIEGIPAEELAYADTPTEEDLVIYKDWVGRVTAITHMISVKLADNCVVEINDHAASHADDVQDTFTVGDVAISKKKYLRTGKWIYGQYNPNTPPVGTVVQLRPLGIEITWLQRRIASSDEIEPPNVLERDEFESNEFYVYDRTRRPRQKLASTTISNSDIDAQLGVRVRFKDLSGACVKYGDRLPRIDRSTVLGYDLNVFDIVKFQTKVTVQWQDLSVTEEQSTNLIPDTSIDDEHAAWPGEIAHSLDVQPVPNLPNVKQPSKVGVIQSVNADERMASVRWCPDAVIQYTSIQDNGPAFRAMVTASLGGRAGLVEDVSLYDLEAPAEMNVRRGDVVLLAQKGYLPSSSSREWLGEVVDTCLDGTLVVRLGAAEEVRDIVVQRDEAVVAVRSDGANHVEEWDQMDDWSAGYSDVDEVGPEVMLDGSGHLGVWHGQRDSSEDEDSEHWTTDEEAPATYEDENGQPLDEEDVEGEEWESDDDVEMPDAPAQGTPPTSTSATPPNETSVIPAAIPPSTHSAENSTAPEQYLILDTDVPSSHHFSSKPPTALPAHTKRVQKEHKILRTPGNLPSGVFVRSWESRLDLLRILLLGPTETPYQDCPFIIDLYLPPSFPHEPPAAHFHSWTSEPGLGGVGRVNPNLYEDGKICLSILGTWEGSRGEGWNAARSTLLQVVVSLLGLVLVKEPYFNEAGYEPLAGLEASKRPSVLYSERAYLRARTFVITALGKLRQGEGSTGLEGLEDVLRFQYVETKGPMLLKKIVGDVEEVLRKSREGEDVELDGMTVMSKGACIPLQRVLDRLKGLQG